MQTMQWFIEGLREIHDRVVRITGRDIKLVLLNAGFLAYLLLFRKAVFLLVVDAIGDYLLMVLGAVVLYWFWQGAVRALQKQLSKTKESSPQGNEEQRSRSQDD